MVHSIQVISQGDIVGQNIYTNVYLKSMTTNINIMYTICLSHSTYLHNGEEISNTKCHWCQYIAIQTFSIVYEPLRGWYIGVKYRYKCCFLTMFSFHNHPIEIQHWINEDERAYLVILWRNVTIFDPIDL